MKRSVEIAGLALLLALVGCEPKERVQWSPDGSRAAVLLDYHLHLAEPTGKLTGVLADRDGEPGRLLVDAFDWLPDGTGLVVQRIRVTSRWEQLRSLLPAAEASRVESLAARMPELLSAAVQLHGDADRADQLLEKLAPGEGDRTLNALRYALETNGEAVKEALAAAPRALAGINRAGIEEMGYLLHELALVRRGSLNTEEETQVFFRGLRAAQTIRISPGYSVVACLRQTAESNRFNLEILALDGSFHVEIARGIAPAFDWTPDGRSLVFMAPLSHGDGLVMRLQRVAVLDDRGLATRLEPNGGREDLAFALIPFSPRLAVLPNGDVLFASQPGTFPMRGGELNQTPRLYRLPASGGDPVAIPTAEGTLPMDLGYFAVSPDGRRVALVESGTDAVAVVDLENGETELIATPHPHWKSRTLPAWRNATELSYVSLGAGLDRVSWRLRRGDTVVDLSATWPSGATANWLERKETPNSEGQTP